MYLEYTPRNDGRRADVWLEKESEDEKRNHSLGLFNTW